MDIAFSQVLVFVVLLLAGVFGLRYSRHRTPVDHGGLLERSSARRRSRLRSQSERIKSDVRAPRNAIGNRDSRREVSGNHEDMIVAAQLETQVITMGATQGDAVMIGADRSQSRLQSARGDTELFGSRSVMDVATDTLSSRSSDDELARRVAHHRSERLREKASRSLEVTPEQVSHKVQARTEQQPEPSATAVAIEQALDEKAFLDFERQLLDTIERLEQEKQQQLAERVSLEARAVCAERELDLARREREQDLDALHLHDAQASELREVTATVAELRETLAETELALAIATRERKRVEVQRQQDKLAFAERVDELQAQLNQRVQRIYELERAEQSTSLPKPNNGQAKQAEEAAPRKLLFNRPNNRDDLKKIKGVGPVMERILNELGITTFEQIANFGPDDVARVAAQINTFPGRIEKDDWVGGARRQHALKYSEPEHA